MKFIDFMFEDMIEFRIYDSKLNVVFQIILIGLVCLLAVIVGTLTFVDYSGFGVLTVLIFYIAKRMPNWYMKTATQVLGLWMIKWMQLWILQMQSRVFFITIHSESKKCH